MKKNLLSMYADELTIDELKEKRKLVRKAAYIYMIISMIIFVFAIVQYVVSRYVGMTVILIGCFLSVLCGGYFFKNMESDLTMIISYHMVKGDK